MNEIRVFDIDKFEIDFDIAEFDKRLDVELMSCGFSKKELSGYAV